MDGNWRPLLRWFLGVLALALVSGPLGDSSVAAMPDATVIRTVSITNVTDVSFTVNWVTDFQVPGSGSLHYGTTKDNLSAVLVENTLGGALGDIHSITVSGLDASTTYYFTIHDASLVASNNGSLYSVTTGKTLSTAPPIYFVSGTVTQADGKTPVVGALVTVRVTDYNNLNPNGISTSAPLSGLSAANGNWVITFAPRLPDSSGLFQFNPNGGDSLLASVEAGSQGNSGTHTFPLTLDANGKMTAGVLTVAPGTVPTDTPVPLGGTPAATATGTPTIEPTLAASPLPTDTVPPTVTPRVTIAPAATAIREAPTAAPPPPSPTPVEPSPVPAEVIGQRPVASPTHVTSNPSASEATPAVGSRPSVATPIAPGGNPSVAPTPFGVPTVIPLFSTPSLRFQNPPTATPRVVGLVQAGTATAASGNVPPSSVVTAVPPVSASVATGSEGASPLRQLTALFAGAFGLLGVGLAILAIGVVSQMRHGDDA
ncbi:MAG TPA: fibronectin type III domain-containing protein [Chloroflexota bacterium]|nr:fibronectin type III domain-containing protein [Chloroflexota bacterium]